MALYGPRTSASGVPRFTSVGATRQLEPRRRELGQGQQLDRVAELAGVLEVGQLQPVDALARDVAGLDVRLEGELGEDRQLVGGVGAVHVERRVGLGVAELPGPGPGRRRRASPRASSWSG